MIYWPEFKTIFSGKFLLKISKSRFQNNISWYRSLLSLVVAKTKDTQPKGHAGLLTWHFSAQTQGLQLRKKRCCRVTPRHSRGQPNFSVFLIKFSPVGRLSPFPHDALVESQKLVDALRIILVSWLITATTQTSHKWWVLSHLQLQVLCN